MIKTLHIILAYLTVAGFVVRGFWALRDAPQRHLMWVRILPHIVDTLLLVLGITLAVQLAISPFEGWLAAKLLGLLAYIGFGVVTMRAPTRTGRVVGFVLALASVGYVFAVAFTRQTFPFA